MALVLILAFPMRKFILVWSGQTASIIGSQMTSFAMTIWAWEITGHATALALFGLFNQLPRILIAPFAGVIVDRFNRKVLMMVGDTVAGLSAIAILLLYLTGNLQIWHLYVTATINGSFEEIQELAYLAAISTMVPKQQYSRASSISFLASYGSSIVAPAASGTFYPTIGFMGIVIIDIATFAIAIATLLLTPIPQPTITETESFTHPNIYKEIWFGWRYIVARPSLLAMLVFISLFWFAHDFGASLYAPMILARTGNDARVLATVASVAGGSGVVGALLMSTLGGPKRRIHGFLLGTIAVGMSKMVFGFAQILWIWIPAQFCSSINFPMLGSCSDAIWLAKVKPQVQGRVFAIRSMSVSIASTLGYCVAGPLADYVFEPAMKPGGSLAAIFGGMFGNKAGAGMALLYVISSICLLAISLIGYTSRRLRDVETITPDSDVE